MRFITFVGFSLLSPAFLHALPAGRLGSTTSAVYKFPALAPQSVWTALPRKNSYRFENRFKRELWDRQSRLPIFRSTSRIIDQELQFRCTILHLFAITYDDFLVVLGKNNFCFLYL